MNDSDKSELKSCPFCGGKPTYEPRVAALDRVNYWPEMVSCPACLLCFRSDDHRRGNDAVKFWNTRSPSDSVRKLVEALERLASCEAFHMPRASTEEEIMRMKFAEDALTAYRKEMEK